MAAPKEPLRTFPPVTIGARDSTATTTAIAGKTKQENQARKLDLSREIKSAELMLGRIKGTGGDPAVETTRCVVEGYLGRLVAAERTGELEVEGVEAVGGRGDADGDGGVVLRVGDEEGILGEGEAGRMMGLAGELVDIIEEVKARQRYISNQLTLLRLKKGEQQGPSTTQSHITKLQRYNHVKDVAQELMGLVADNRGVTIGHLYRSGEFGVDPED